MIATLSLDVTYLLAAFGWAGLGTTLIGLAMIVVRAIAERPRRVPRPAPAAVLVADPEAVEPAETVEDAAAVAEQSPAAA